MCHFDFAENCIFGFFTGDFKSHEKTKILFSSNVPVSRFLAHKGPTAALYWAWEVVIASKINPGRGLKRAFLEGASEGPTGPPWGICSISRRKDSRYSKKLVAEVRASPLPA